MDWIVNKNWLTWILVLMLKIYRTYNPMVKFLKYEFNKKLWGNITLLNVTLGITWI